MSKRVPKELLPTKRKAIKYLPSRKSFSLPKKTCNKQIPNRNMQDKINKSEIDSETSYETITDLTISLDDDDDTDFCNDSDELEYSSIEVARSACNTYTLFPNSSCDVLVYKKSLLTDFSSDPGEFFDQNHPIAASTPKKSIKAFSSHLIKEDSDQFLSFNKPTACSTLIKKPLSYCLCEEDEKLKSFMDFSEHESTIIEPAASSLILPTIKDSQEAMDPGVEDINEFLNSMIPEMAELSKCDRGVLTSHDTNLTNRTINNKYFYIKSKDVEYASQETNGTKEDTTCTTYSKDNERHVHQAKKFESKPFLCLHFSPEKHFKPVIQQSTFVKDNQEAANTGLKSIKENFLFFNDTIQEVTDLSDRCRVALTAQNTNSINRVVTIKESKLKAEVVEHSFQKTNAMKKDLACNTNSKENKKHVNKAKGFENIPICVLTLPPKRLKPVIQQSRPVKENAELPECDKVAFGHRSYENIPICPLSNPSKYLIPIKAANKESGSKIKRNKKNAESSEKGKKR